MGVMMYLGDSRFAKASVIASVLSRFVVLINGVDHHIRV